MCACGVMDVLKNVKTRKCKRDGSPGPTSKRANKERDLVAELKEIHSDKYNLSDPRY